MGLMLREPDALPARSLPEPEDVFLSWLMALPATIDPAAAADTEIRRLDGYAGPHPGPARLLELFTAFRRSLGPFRSVAGSC